MKAELQDKLYSAYPSIFVQKDLDMTQTAMCWGISCGDGWYYLIDELCGNIQNHVDNFNRNKPEEDRMVCQATQVKEKFGGLCFYTYGGDEYIDGMISFAESMSYHVCTECGQRSEKNESNRGWIYTLCSSCKENK
mgnify:CR=1 FL=1|tara:strand:- start:2463 stop:2870 length:408 start_codon:yes stop_codon:yes gene_type:complete